MTTTHLKHWPCRAFRIKGALVLVVQKPIPKGWKLAGLSPSHHTKYSIFIEREGA